MSNWATRLIPALWNTRIAKREQLRRLAASPDDPLAMLRVAELFAKEKARAVLLHRRAAARDSATGRLGQAGAALRRALRLAPDDPHVREQLSALTDLVRR